jgi:hypothetical protein
MMHRFFGWLPSFFMLVYPFLKNREGDGYARPALWMENG